MEYNPTSESGFTENEWAGIEHVQAKHYAYADNYYFESYAHYGIHEEMIKDSVRTNAYRNAILRNSYLFSGKTVLDVGCGTGILSFFAVRAGASRVYAVDSSDIIDYAQEVAVLNNFAGKITFIKGKVEDISIPEQVDILISEWMGHFLLYESMLGSVLYARDQWLKPGGMMFPDQAKLWLGAIEDATFKHDKIEFWCDIHGIDMTVMRTQALREPVIDSIEKNHLISTFCPILDLNLLTATVSDLTFTASYKLYVTKQDTFHALVGWFEVSFSHCHLPVVLSTSPKNTETHWKNVMFYLDRPWPVNLGEHIEGSIALRMNSVHPRELDIKFSFHVLGEAPMHTTQYYRLR